MIESPMVVRKCHNLDEMSACVALQKEVWNFAEAELVPLRMFVVAEKIGGQVIGAFDNGKLVAFALSLPGSRGGHCYLHSQMLAVEPAYRNAGLGRQVKLFQRKDALARGFELMEWTFDPLEIKNAYLNIEKLGAIARRYQVNQYGLTTSPLQGGLPSDRLIAEWWLKSKRVQAAQQGCAVPRIEAQRTIEVPAPIYEWKASSTMRNHAKSIQDNNKTLFIQAFSNGLSVLNFTRDAAGNGIFCLGKWDENVNFS